MGSRQWTVKVSVNRRFCERRDRHLPTGTCALSCVSIRAPAKGRLRENSRCRGEKRRFRSTPPHSALSTQPSAPSTFVGQDKDPYREGVLSPCSVCAFCRILSFMIFKSIWGGAPCGQVEITGTFEDFKTAEIRGPLDLPGGCRRSRPLLPFVAVSTSMPRKNGDQPHAQLHVPPPVVLALNGPDGCGNVRADRGRRPRRSIRSPTWARCPGRPGASRPPSTTPATSPATPSRTRRLARWPSSGGTARSTSLGKLAGGNYSQATAINSFGVVVGDGDTGNFRPQSWVTRPTGLFNFFPNNGGNTHAVGINDAGAICGYYTKSLSGYVSSWRGSIWTPDPKDPRKYRQVDLPILVGLDPTFKGTTALPIGVQSVGPGRRLRDQRGHRPARLLLEQRRGPLDRGPRRVPRRLEQHRAGA